MSDRIFCCYCGRHLIPPLRITTEHIIPLSKGGSNRPLNKVTCCSVCNHWRGNYSLEYWKEKIVKRIVQNRRTKEFTIYDLKIIVENIDYMQDYVKLFGDKLYLNVKGQSE